MRSGDATGDHTEAPVGFAMPGEALVEHEHLVRFAVPLPEEQLLLLTEMNFDESEVAEWFGDFKPYNTFASKIRGAHTRALIDDETRSDLVHQVSATHSRTRGSVWTSRVQA